MGNVLRISFIFCMAFGFTFLSSKKISTESTYPLNTEFIIWNAGQGDMMTLISNKSCWYFDLGGSKPLPSFLFKELRNRCFHKEVWAFISHFDKDHIAFYKTMDQITPVEKLFVSHKDTQTKFSQKMIQYFSRQGTEIIALLKGHSFKNKNIKLECLWPKTIGFIKNENARSLVLLLTVKNKKILLTGDLPGFIEKKLPPLPEIDILKIAHHGSGSSTGKLLLNTVKAKTCVISAGKFNKYGHPHLSLLMRLKNSACSILRTDFLGTIRFIF